MRTRSSGHFYAAETRVRPPARFWTVRRRLNLLKYPPASLDGSSILRVQAVGSEVTLARKPWRRCGRVQPGRPEAATLEEVLAPDVCWTPVKEKDLLFNDSNCKVPGLSATPTLSELNYNSRNKHANITSVIFTFFCQ